MLMMNFCGVEEEVGKLSSRKFQGWNCGVPVVELASSSGGIRQFQQWNSTICSNLRARSNMR